MEWALQQECVFSSFLSATQQALLLLEAGKFVCLFIYLFVAEQGVGEGESTNEADAWMKLVHRGPPLLPPSAPRLPQAGSKGARPVPGSVAGKQGGCAATPLCFKTLCQHHKSESQALSKLRGEVTPSHCSADWVGGFFFFPAAKPVVSGELALISFIAGVSDTEPGKSRVCRIR